ncbi:MAG: type II secretion system F family protein, partial [archaeon]
RKALAEVKSRGSSVQEALFALSERSNSIAFKRSVAHLVGVYEQGGSKKSVAESLRRIALEQLQTQRIEAKAFSQKLVVFSLMFIAISAIIPALFQAFIVVGSAFLEVSITPLQALLIPTVLFPSIDLGILIYVKSKTPVFLEE